MHCRQSAATCFVCRQLHHVSKHFSFLSHHLATCTAGKVHASSVLWLAISQSVQDTARETFSTAQSQSSASIHSCLLMMTMLVTASFSKIRLPSISSCTFLSPFSTQLCKSPFPCRSCAEQQQHCTQAAALRPYAPSSAIDSALGLPGTMVSVKHGCSPSGSSIRSGIK